jgi:hypothetical protein
LQKIGKHTKVLNQELKIQKEKFLLTVGAKQLKKLYPNIQL